MMKIRRFGASEWRTEGRDRGKTTINNMLPRQLPFPLAIS
jgi:hypothetical protein